MIVDARVETLQNCSMFLFPKFAASFDALLRMSFHITEPGGNFWLCFSRPKQHLSGLRRFHDPNRFLRSSKRFFVRLTNTLSASQVNLIPSQTAFLSCHFEVPGWTIVLALDEQRDIPKLGAFSRAFFYEHLLELSVRKLPVCDCEGYAQWTIGANRCDDSFVQNTVLLETQGSS